ncbi:hypothetical protein G7B40_041945 [Aetokthonos hydrillicola Thurmond2011]|uniref:Uncharacterized protein n=1 Tax=Aetokthonos hydrillicola Thurmond2011 TaxID=2712845 RepID=A0AAP5IHH3_9CYAN|nr:hypothetical protein [Aetokthonos hydrillicola]MDR9900969.1 hypothetical protein [Aetokthonos hydrillicola Thurmond2011]
MECLWCGKKLGFLRRILDKEFCSAEHRRLATITPEGVVFEQDATSDYDTRELWTVEKDKRKGPKKSSGVVVFVALGGAAVLMVALSDGSKSGAPPQNGGGGSALSLPNMPGAPGAGQQSKATSAFSLGSLFQSRGSVTLTHDFANGVGDWVSSTASAAKDWSIEPSGLRPGSLRIWKRSASLSNYDMEFVGQIEQKSMNWAFRATDSRNYYASKLTINRPANGGAPNAGITRFAMLDGHEVDRVRLPLPISLERGRPYRIRLSVQGTRFITAVNGRTVSSWSDHRISKGGIGFFSEEGESATVRWVSLSERDSTLGRLLSHFAILQPLQAFYPADNE